MSTYRAPLEDFRFLLHQVFPAADLSATELYREATLDIFEAVLDEAAKLGENVLSPLHQPADKIGCRLENGVVTTPTGFPEAYKAFAEGGWPGLTALEEHGGQGLPHSLYLLVDEIVSSANSSFAMYRGLIDGAYRAILEHASEELKGTYLPLLASGEVLPTMNLTEPHCGSDLGLLRTKAEPCEDGSYKISGTKIFITGGDHDLTHNILHLVLAKLPNAPAGSRGISLFLVPKYLTDPKSGAEFRNAVVCSGLEHKMGLKGSATCVMNYEGATGWMVGKPNAGLKAMFTMMNSARLGVGVQGVCASEAALQIAVAYALERRQGAAPGSADPASPDPIIKHPDVQRMILIQKAYGQGGRALALQMALALDLSHAEPDAEVREVHDDIAQLMTPIVKAFLTDAGLESANLAVQTMGGHGYISEWGVEQWVRDVRIASIYEGTNGIQALDLVGRKLSMHNGRLAERYFHMLECDLNTAQPTFAWAGLGLQALKTLREITVRVIASSSEAKAWIATDYLKLFGFVALAGVWSKMAVAASEHSNENPDFCADKVRTAEFYMRRILPQHLGLAAGIIDAL